MGRGGDSTRNPDNVKEKPSERKKEGKTFTWGEKKVLTGKKKKFQTKGPT